VQAPLMIPNWHRDIQDPFSGIARWHWQIRSVGQAPRIGLWHRDFALEWSIVSVQQAFIQAMNWPPGFRRTFPVSIVEVKPDSA
jgi:hypothetical protein